MSSSPLLTRLDELEEAGVLEAGQCSECTPRVEFELAEDGVALSELLEPLLEWVEERND